MSKGNTRLGISLSDQSQDVAQRTLRTDPPLSITDTKARFDQHSLCTPLIYIFLRSRCRRRPRSLRPPATGNSTPVLIAARRAASAPKPSSRTRPTRRLKMLLGNPTRPKRARNQLPSERIRLCSVTRMRANVEISGYLYFVAPGQWLTRDQMLSVNRARRFAL